MQHIILLTQIQIVLVKKGTLWKINGVFTKFHIQGFVRMHKIIGLFTSR